MNEPLYLYRLGDSPDRFSLAYFFDEALAVSCAQGLFNRSGPKLYVTCRDDDYHRNGIIGTTDWGVPIVRTRCTPMYWLDKLTAPDGWLHGREIRTVCGLEALLELTRPALRGIVLWDTKVPATVNVATTIAGVEDLVPMSEELYEAVGRKTGLPVVQDLRGKFDGSVYGTPHTDAYRWAIEHYLAAGKCSLKVVGQYTDSWVNRQHGYTSYVLERDRMVAERAFVFDLSPWDDFAPDNDPDQRPGTDKETLLLIFDTVRRLAKGKNMTEFCGFFNSRANIAGQPNGVFTEWELVYLMSPYNFYQNTASADVYNQTLHKWAPYERFTQHRPAEKRKPENKTYLCIQICDMDSTTPLYDVMPVLWDDPARGSIPLAWGLNPNLSGILPDLFRHYYQTASENDYFCADASAAGYFNPTRILPEYWDMVEAHNRYWFDRTDMTIAGMVLDDTYATDEVLHHFSRFAPDGFASLLTHRHEQLHANPPHTEKVVNGMPVGFMTMAGCDWEGPEQTARILQQAYLKDFSPERPEFLYYRICYRSPSDMLALVDELRRQNPQLTIEPVDPYTYFDLLRQKCEQQGAVEK